VEGHRQFDRGEILMAYWLFKSRAGILVLAAAEAKRRERRALERRAQPSGRQQYEGDDRRRCRPFSITPAKSGGLWESSK